MSESPRLGATVDDDGRVTFNVWAPKAERVEVRLLDDGDRNVALTRDDEGYHSATVDGPTAGDRYLYRLDGDLERPDPASREQRSGVHGPSSIVDHRFDWSVADWGGVGRDEYILYELHVGAFTADGTFAGVEAELDRLRELGITAIELLPIAQCPGERNWGYDGVYPYAVQWSYGGADGLKRLVDACHQRGLAVCLDVVLNHLGPEGCYLADFGPYFTNRYLTPWGAALNVDGHDSDPVRRFLLDNALEWIVDYRIDALRLDAVHEIHDRTALHFLEELALIVDAEGRRRDRKIHLFPESDANDARLVSKLVTGGRGLDAMWNDDFHHALHGALTSERGGHYVDFGGLAPFAATMRDGLYLAGRHSKFRGRRHGASAESLDGHQLIVYAQNHDQVGNRPTGDRLTAQLSFEELKLTAAAVLLSPYTPLLFMGEEYGETAPFPYFVDHSDPALVQAVNKGRKEQAEELGVSGTPPLPSAIETFNSSKLGPDLRKSEPHRTLERFYQRLIELRRQHPALARGSRQDSNVVLLGDERVLLLERWSDEARLVVLLNFTSDTVPIEPTLTAGRWRRLLDSSRSDWRGPGSELPDELNGDDTPTVAISGHGVALYEKVETPADRTE